MTLNNQKLQEKLNETNQDDKKLKNEIESMQKEINQLKQKQDQEIMANSIKNQPVQNEISEKLQTQQNDLTQSLIILKEKFDQELAAIKNCIDNKVQQEKMEKQDESQIKQDIQQTLEQISTIQNNLEKCYHQTNLPSQLKNLQDFEKILIKLIGTVDDENIIIPSDQNRLQRTQSFVYKLYEESSNKRAVDLQYRYFVRQTVNFNEMAQNYSLPLSSKAELKKNCTSYKPVRGDGNCFYTAFVYQFLEFVICSYNQTQFQQFIKHCFDINLSMRLKINKHEQEFVDEQLQKELLNEFFYRLQEIRNIQNLDERKQVYEKQFAAFEKQNEQIDGCFYALASIFIRNYTNYAVEFHEFKEQLFDRANLLIWEEECESSTEVVMQSLQKKLNLDITLIFIQNDNCILVNKYENNSKFKIILILKPGHYGIGYLILCLYLKIIMIINKFLWSKQMQKLLRVNLNLQHQIQFVLKLSSLQIYCRMVDYLNQLSQNIVKVRPDPLEEQNIY